MSPAPGAADPVRPGGGGAPVPGTAQDAAAFDHAQQAVQVQGVQNNFFGGSRRAVVAVSVEPPLGLRDASRPVRGRDGVLAALADWPPAAGVHVVCGLGGCGKTTLALEAAFTAGRAGARVWWVSAAEPGALEAGMRAVGRRLGVPGDDLERGDAADVIWARLNACADRWLLVIDSADDPQALAGPGPPVAEGRAGCGR
jgi:hypothetical protein